ncbi:MAG: STAS/SEC14 domain-containing protein [Candidatus Eisenbacteria bacterium]|uniref:STAS/SEC14 domain-containing protein n=1 Tax=Eiseniibacteriota bacterium TaxID=2212470 RepID=A0A9D6L7J4_UNCEI|nr:STAS/SEC14 domain-containing protein [Candidatus Eisenbacteria bacterium]MBI3540373.1 STAS/SEC14 domain-containing protein [Candidatus Eisenbacteria bacterium]
MAFVIVDQTTLVRVTFHGALTEADLQGIADAAEEIERGRHPVPHRIADLSGVTEVRVDYEDMKVLAGRRRRIKFANAFRSAIVVKTPVQMGMARMFQTLNDNPQIEIRIFEDEAPALQWLASPAIEAPASA